MRPIDADLVVSKLQAVLDGKANEKESTAYFAFRAFIDLIDTEPTIDPATLAPRWRDAKTDPPKEYRDEYGELVPFLVCEKGTEYPFRGLYDGETWGDGLISIYPTHWQPFPEPPKRVGENDGENE